MPVILNLETNFVAGNVANTIGASSEQSLDLTGSKMKPWLSTTGRSAPCWREFAAWNSQKKKVSAPGLI